MLGPPVCLSCNVVGVLVDHLHWRCPCCFTEKLDGNITHNPHYHEIPPIDMIHEYSTKRPFMHGTSPALDPNEYYRLWLEEKIGKQGIDWDWELSKTDFNFVHIMFSSSDNGTLFELTWA